MRYSIPITSISILNLRVGQLNLGRSRLATHELRELAFRDGYDLLLLQEPYTISNTVGGFGMRTRVLTSCGQGTPWAAIVILNDKIVATNLSHLGNEYLVCAHVEFCGAEMYVVSAYLRHGDRIDAQLGKIEQVLLVCNGQVIIGTDANAKSEAWGSGCTDLRGAAVEEFIAQYGLVLHNDPSMPCTFEGPVGRSRIDITVTRDFDGECSWRVLQGATASDHNLMKVMLTMEGRCQAHGESISPRFATKRANWVAFAKALQSACCDLRTQIDSVDDIDIAVEELESRVIHACKVSMPPKRIRRVGVRWWTRELDDLKKATGRSRRRFKRQRDPVRRELLRNQYVLDKGVYTKAVLTAKKASWRQFVDRVGNEDPWGFVYRQAAGRIAPRRAANSISSGGTSTTTWEGSANLLLDCLLMVDDPREDDDGQAIKRIRARIVPNDDTTDPVEEGELLQLVRKLRNRKVPGIDLIENETIKRAWSIIGDPLRRIFNACLGVGYYPKRWKEGIICALLKGKDKEPSDPKSYRPLCLLTTFEKLLERLMFARLSPLTSGDRGNQHGFCAGRSTTSAILQLRVAVEECREKYVLGIFFDITGAFDSVWWPDILVRLQDLRCPGKLLECVKSYLEDRSVIMRESGHEVRREVNRGCPQGSVLGPLFWNLVFDSALERLGDLPDCRTIGYADDVAVLVFANSRAQLAERGQKVIDTLRQWCCEHKMAISQTKTEAVLLKGNLDEERPPQMSLGERRLRLVPKVKYLGVMIDRSLRFHSHARYVASRGVALMRAMQKLARANWGLRFPVMITIYRGVFVPVVTYAAPTWESRATKGDIRQLESAQRVALIAATKAYRTASAPALCVLAGVRPIALELRRASLRHNLREGVVVRHRGTVYDPNREAYPSLLTRLDDSFVDEWQESWSLEERGQVTRDFFPDVRARLEMDWVRPGHYTSQFLTGHGNFRAKLHQLGLAEEWKCTCAAVPQTAGHVLIDCPKFVNERAMLRNCVVAAGLPWPPNMSNLVEKEIYPALELCVIGMFEAMGYCRGRLRERGAEALND